MREQLSRHHKIDEHSDKQKVVVRRGSRVADEDELRPVMKENAKRVSAPFYAQRLWVHLSINLCGVRAVRRR